MPTPHYALIDSFLIRFEPTPLFVYFDSMTPGFARINTPKEGWDEDKRKHTFFDKTIYLAPPVERMKGHFVLLHNWPISINIKDKKQIVFSIPKHTPTDFASIPRLLHSFVSPLDNSIYSAVLHDYLYRNPSENIPRGISKELADSIFYFGLKAKGKSRFKALLFYWGVKYFGHGSYIRK